MTASARTFAAIAIISVLLIAFAAAAWTAALDKCATVDEPSHLLAAWTQHTFGDFRADCENPPLWKIPVALGLPPDLFHIDRKSPQWQSLLWNADNLAPICSEALYHTAGVDADTLLRSSRARMVAFGILVGIVIAWWSWRLGGRVAAVFAAIAFCFDPNFLAHSPLIKNDVPLTLALLLFSAAVWLFGERATAPRFFLIALFMGAAFMFKFSGLLALPVLAIALFARSLIPRPWPIGPFSAPTSSSRLAFSAGVLVACTLFLWLFTWACYDFRFLPSPDSPDRFEFTDTLQYFANHQAFAQSPDPFHLDPARVAEFRRHWQPPFGVRAVIFASDHHLIPQSCAAGMLRVDAVSQARVTFLCGRSSVTGWWYYFPLAILFKTPVATLLGILAAALIFLPKLRGFSPSNAWPIMAATILPTVYLLVAMCSNVDVGIRHILPVYPFLFIFLGVAAATAWNKGKGRGRLIVSLLTIALIAETAAAYPNYLAFFNVIAGGPRGGLRLLSESNLDWGQDLPALAHWQSDHPDRPLYLMYWGSADPRYYGLHYINLPESTAPPDLPSPPPGRPVFAVSAVILTNPFVLDRQKQFFDSILHRPPIAILNGSIYLYDAP